MNQEREQITQVIAHLEAQRGTLGDAVVNSAVATLRDKLTALRPTTTPRRKQVTILFADISGFTSVAETMDAEELSDLINTLWMRFDAIITASGGMVDKHMGDAVMAIFGAPIAHEDDPERAVRCALMMQAAINELRPLDSKGSELGLRIGINSGPVLMAEVGAKLEYTAMGDTVNLAERLQKASPANGILIAHDTYLQTQGVFQIERLGELAVRGKANPVRTYLVRAEKPRSLHTANRGVVGLKVGMVGRDRELQRLERTYQAVVESNNARLLTVIGEAGVGKSRLRREFGQRIETSGEPTVLLNAQAHVLSFGLPYALLRQLFAAYLAVRDNDPPMLAQEKLAQGVMRLLGAHGEQAAQLIGRLIGWDGVGLQEGRDAAFAAATDFFTALAASQPLVLLLDDIHWADDGSLDFIEYLVGRARDYPLLVVASARPALLERSPGFGAEVAGLRLNLAPLSDIHSRILARDILRRVADLPPALLNLIVSRSEGNPFYLEELIKMLTEDGVIVRGEGAWRVDTTLLDNGRIPPTLTGVLQARLDSLPPFERETLERASIVGRVFWSGLVAQLAGLGEEQRATQLALEALARKELIYKRIATDFSGHDEYSFRHVLLREVTYESVLRKTRRDYHAMVVEWLVQQSGERVTEYAALIGEHYERAENSVAAGRWYIRAARAAQDSYLDAIAISYYQRALELLPEAADYQADKVQIYKGLGEIYKNQARFNEALAVYFSMIQAAQDSSDAEEQANGWLGMAFCQDELGDHHASLRSVTKAEAVAREKGERTMLTRALHGKGWVLHLLGQFDAAESLAQEALTIARQLDNPILLFNCMNLLATISTQRGDHRQSVSWFEQCLAQVRRLGSKSRLPIALSNLGEAKMRLGDYIAAADLFSAALSMAQEVGSRRGELTAMTNLGAAQLARADYLSASLVLEQAIALAGSDQPPFLTLTYATFSAVKLAEDNLEGALAAAQQAMRLAQSTSGWEFTAPAWLALAEIAARSGQPITLGTQAYTADELFANAINTYREAGMHADADNVQRRRDEALAAYHLPHPNSSSTEQPSAYNQLCRSSCNRYLKSAI